MPTLDETTWQQPQPRLDGAPLDARERNVLEGSAPNYYTENADLVLPRDFAKQPITDLELAHAAQHDAGASSLGFGDIAAAVGTEVLDAMLADSRREQEAQVAVAVASLDTAPEVGSPEEYEVLVGDITRTTAYIDVVCSRRAGMTKEEYATELARCANMPRSDFTRAA